MHQINEDQVNDDLQVVCQDRASANRFIARVIQTALPIALRAAAKLHPNAVQRAAMEATADLCERDATRDAAIAVAAVAQRAETSVTGDAFRKAGLDISRFTQPQMRRDHETAQRTDDPVGWSRKMRAELLINGYGRIDVVECDGAIEMSVLLDLRSIEVIDDLARS